MAITTSYLNPATRNRSMTTESDFALGMKYTDNALDEGYSKVLLNYALADNGASLRPRSGLEQTQILTSITTDNPIVVWGVADVLVLNAAETNSTMCKVVIYGEYDEDTNTVNYTTCKAVALINGVYKQNIGTGVFNAIETGSLTGFTSYGLRCVNKPEQVHGLTYLGQAGGCFSVLNGNLYTSVVSGTSMKLVQLVIKQTAGDAGISLRLKEISPETINAAKAVHNGYNMLSDTPFSFSNETTSGTAVIMDGLIPYDKSGNICLHSKVGDEIKFKLIYRYPTAHATGTTKYYVQWEIKDIDSDNTRVLQRVRDSAVITPGNEISIVTTQTAFKQFTLICKLYNKTQVDSVPYENDALDAVNCKTIATISTAYYYLTDSTANIQTTQFNNYNLMDATGMTTWQQRIVVWGVNGCKNTLWVSDINNPSYFPFPNNVETFDDEIITALKWKSSLIVFTKSTVNQLDFTEDGITITNKTIQDRMVMTEGEECTVLPVQNMVFFKNQNYYYMIVPAASQKVYNSGELTLAPISKPISNIFDNFHDEVCKIFDTVVSNEVYDYHCYLEGSCIRMVYKMYDMLEFKFIDIVFQYDTKLRTWSLLSFDSDRYRMTQYIPSVTADSIFIRPYQSATGTWTMELLQANPLSAADDYAITIYDEDMEYTVNTAADVTHFIDTGFRKLNDYENLNKKWRQIQFGITNVTQDTLQFYSTIQVDNEKRKMIEYESDTDDDGNVIITPVYEVIKSNDDIVDEAVAWGIPAERFDDTPLARVKINTNGKGRYIRFTLKDTNDFMYELNKITYVFRIMTGR